MLHWWTPVSIYLGMQDNADALILSKNKMLEELWKPIQDLCKEKDKHCFRSRPFYKLKGPDVKCCLSFSIHWFCLTYSVPPTLCFLIQLFGSRFRQRGKSFWWEYIDRVGHVCLWGKHCLPKKLGVTWRCNLWSKGVKRCREDNIQGWIKLELVTIVCMILTHQHLANLDVEEWRG